MTDDGLNDRNYESSLMQIDNNTDTLHTAKCYLGSHLYPNDVALMTREQFLEYLAERDDIWAFGNGQLLVPEQLTDALWETIDTVHIGPALVGDSKAHKEETE